MSENMIVIDESNFTGKIIKKNKDVYFYKNGMVHNDEGPAILRFNGDKEYYKNDKLHRINGPAIEKVNGDVYYYKKGKLHNDNGPAVITKTTTTLTELYYINNLLSREDGPAEIVKMQYSSHKYFYYKNIYLGSNLKDFTKVLNDYKANLLLNKIKKKVKRDFKNKTGEFKIYTAQVSIKNGNIHNDDKEAVSEDSLNFKSWFLNGKRILVKNQKEFVNYCNKKMFS